MRKKPLFLIVLLAFVVIAVLTIFAYTKSHQNYSSHPSITHEDWKTFTDPNNIFSFQYPSDLEMNSISFGRDLKFSKGVRSDPEIIGFYLPNDKNHREQFSVMKIPNTKRLSLSAYIQQNLNKENKSTKEETNINGYDVLVSRTEWPCKNNTCDSNSVEMKQTHVYFLAGQFIVTLKTNTYTKFTSFTTPEVLDENRLFEVARTFKFISP